MVPFPPRPKPRTPRDAISKNTDVISVNSNKIPHPIPVSRNEPSRILLGSNLCPDLVVAAQRIATTNPNITAHVYDIRHFEHLKNQYNVMSVPCIVLNNQSVFFGKKNIQQILMLLK